MKDKYGMVYVPGSSLKGALRTAILGAVLYKNRPKLVNESRNLAKAVMQAEKQRIARNRLLRDENEMLAERVFHNCRQLILWLGCELAIVNRCQPIA